MEYNEQYFHYRQVEIRLALARANCTKDGLQIARSIFPHFFETCHGSSGCIWWKLSINARSPHALPQRSVPTMTPWMPWSCLPCSKSNMSCYLFVCTVSWLGWWLWVKSWCFQRNWKHCNVFVFGMSSNKWRELSAVMMMVGTKMFMLWSIELCLH
jgi:hypothetical protein